MRTYPKISIVTPSFNQGRFLEHTMRSVLSQDYSNLEYIVIDGGSTDGSVEIIKRYADRLSFWTSESDHGHGDALNKGFARSSGEIMAWINSDDMYLPWTFQVVAEIFASFPQVMWISGTAAFWSSTGFLMESNRAPMGRMDYLLGNYAWIQQESVFWRRGLWERAGSHITTKYRYMVDGELWSRFFQHSELVTTQCILGGYRVHDTNRAINYADACHDEMRTIVKNMHAGLSKADRATLRLLKALRLPVKLGVNRFFPLSAAYRSIFPALFKQLQHNNLFFHEGKWNMRALPFMLCAPPWA